ncbi:MAG: LysR family transcriptional regulator [Pseudonocardiaceae bacterium]
MAVPELRQLRAFVAVATELSFTRAAEQLHVGQQAVSKTVRQLERELGVELLERSPHKVRLTRGPTELTAVARGPVNDTVSPRHGPRHCHR